MDFDRLDAILKQRKMSRRKLALEVGILPGTMSTAFSRRSGLSSSDLLRIAQYLKVNPLFLEGISDDPAIEDNNLRVQFAFAKSDDVRKAVLINAFDKLNPNGQLEAVKRIEELTEIPRYTKPDKQED